MKLVPTGSALAALMAKEQSFTKAAAKLGVSPSALSHAMRGLEEKPGIREVLANWSPYFSGFHLYYPNRRQASPAFAAFVDAMRYR